MTSNAAGAGTLSDLETVAAQMLAIRAFCVYSQMGLFFALLEGRAIGAERIFAFNRLSADIFRRLAAAGKAGKVGTEAGALVAAMLDEFETKAREMVTKPLGAGHA